MLEQISISFCWFFVWPTEASIRMFLLDQYQECFHNNERLLLLSTLCMSYVWLVLWLRMSTVSGSSLIYFKGSFQHFLKKEYTYSTKSRIPNPNPHRHQILIEPIGESLTCLVTMTSTSTSMFYCWPPYYPLNQNSGTRQALWDYLYAISINAQNS